MIWESLCRLWTTRFGKKSSTTAFQTNTEITRQLQRIKSNNRWPTAKQWLGMARVLSLKEKRVFFGAIAGLVLGIGLTSQYWYQTHLQTVPAIGGTYTEALIGSPQFVNPLYASANDTDADIARLVYSGLMTWDPIAGLVPSLASTYTVSEDGKTYTLSLRQNAKWHDGTPVTARDILFTFASIQDPTTSSPLAPSFRGVTVSQIDDSTVSFVLSAPFSPFLSTLTVGILPAHIWEEIDPSAFRLAEQNLNPIGSGPFRFSSYEKDKKGSILSYTLERFPDYFEQSAFMEQLVFRFYGDAEQATQALNNREVDGLSFAGNTTARAVEEKGEHAVLHPRLPQITALFFNTRRENTGQKNLRLALASALDKESILIDTVPKDARVLHAPIPPDLLTAPTENPAPIQLERSESLLSALGWRKNESGNRVQGTGASEKTLTLTLATVNQPDFTLMAERIATAWRALGITVQMKTLEVADARATIVQNHDFDVFLGSILLGPTADPYPFWHSSQTDEGGLNFSGWQNRSADALILNARTQTNPDKRKETLTAFTKLLNEELPAIFLAQPTYSYITSPKVHGVQLQQILVPSDRFGQVNQWYMKTKRTIAW